MKAKAIALILTSTLALTGLAACGNAGAAGDKPADQAPAQEQTVKPAETQDKAKDAKAETKDAKAETQDAKAETKDAKADKTDASKDAKSADQKSKEEAPATK